MGNNSKFHTLPHNLVPDDMTTLALNEIL